MEIKFLMTFQTIVRTGSFTKAARQLNYTQSTITFHVDQLEMETGVQLFEKSGRRMILTKAGEELIPYVDEILVSVQKIRNFQHDVAECQGTISIGAPESILCFRMPFLLKRLHQKAPHVNIALQSLTSRKVIEALKDGKLDIGFAYDIQDKDKEYLNFSSFENSPVHLYAAPAVAMHCPDLTKENQIIRDITRISTPVPGELRNLFDIYLKKKAISFTNIIELRSTQAIINLIKNDMGMALLPDFSVRGGVAYKELAAIPAEPFQIRSYCGTHKNKWCSPAMELFFDIVAKYQDDPNNF